MAPRDFADLSPVGWFIASYIETTETVESALDPSPDRKVMSVWENRLLVAATTPEEAYSRALTHIREVPRDYMNTEGVMLRVSVAGLASLLPIYEELQDGAEIEWIDHGSRLLKEVKEMVRTPSELRVNADETENS